MSSIKPIGHSDIHRITSGQVIVDLTSAVKELLENALDANATQVTINIKNYGLDSVEVIDNGTGIVEEDFANICLKHYTSKLNTFEDVSSVSTLGFRGEAMSSLCALSELSITTSTKEMKPKAFKLEYNSLGLLTSTTITSGSVGTTVMIKNLFNSLPVRRKDFVKNHKREFQKLLTFIQSYAIITLSSRIIVNHIDSKNKKSVMISTSLPSQNNKSIKSNLLNIFGSNGNYGLNEIDIKLELTTRFKLQRKNFSVQVQGFISNCSFGQGRSATDRQLMFVNGRPVHLPQFLKAINEEYKAFNHLQYPVIILNLILDPMFLDINVTPDKRTVLIHSESLILESLREELQNIFSTQETIIPKNVSSKHVTDIRSRGLQSTLNVADMIKRNEDDSMEEGEEEPNGEDNIEGNEQTLKDIDEAEKIRDNVEESREESELEYESDYENEDELENANGNVSDGAFEAGEGNDSVETSSQPNTEDMILTTETNSTFQNDSPLVKFYKVAEGPRTNNKTSNEKTLETIEYDLDLPNYRPSTRAVKIENLSAYRNDESFPEDNNPMKRKRNLEDELLIVTVGENENEVFQSKLSQSQNGGKLEFIDHEESEEHDHSSCMGHEDIKVKQEANKLVSQRTIKQLTRNSTYRYTMKTTSRPDSFFNTIIDDQETRKKQKKGKGSDLSKESIDDIFDNKEAESLLTLTVSKSDFLKMNIVGQFNLGFILATRKKQRQTSQNGNNEHHNGGSNIDSDLDLFIIDQHASDEKYNFERLSNETVFESQPLVVPPKVELSAIDELIVMNNVKIFEKNGFKLIIDEENEPGERIKLRALPLSKNILFDVSDFHELLYLIKENQSSELGNRTLRPSKTRSMFAMRACRSSIMIGRELNMKTMKRVVQNLAELDKPWNCPHGRPTMRHLMELKSWTPFDEDYQL